ncbi:hypothetical protein JCM5353_003807 [Sporobolomyces roseus]
MESSHARALADETQRITYRSSGLAFRQYNEIYEQWLDHRYSDKIKPFTKRPSSSFDVYLTEEAHRWRVETSDKICAIARRLEELEDVKNSLATMALLWRDLGQRRREELVLSVWEDMCTRAEEGEYIWSREDTPELTLEFVTGLDQHGVGNWIRLWETQGQSEEEKKRSRNDPDALPYRNLRNEKWDRVNGVSEIEASAVPVKKSIRAFVADGVGRRNYHLRQFIEELTAQIAEQQMVTPPTIEHSTKYDAFTSDEKAMLESLRKAGVSISFNDRAASYDVCVYCHIPPPIASRLESLTTGPTPSSQETLSQSRFPALSLTTLSQFPSMDRSAWFHMLNDNPGSYWVACHGQPEDYDPRKSLNATPLDLPYSFENRYETRQVMRSVAFSFINREDEAAVDLVLAFLRAENLDREKEEELNRQVRWIAKLMGKEGEDLEKFVRTEFPDRLTKGLHEIKNNEKYRLIRLYFAWKEALRLDPETGEVEYCTIASLIAIDVNEDPEAIWYTCHPAYPEKNITQAAMRITGPDLDFETKNRDSKFAHTKDRLILTRALRKHILGVLAKPGEDLDSLGILMLSISDPSTNSDRAYQWMLRRTSLDLGLPEELLVREMERMRFESRIANAVSLLSSALATGNPDMYVVASSPDAFPPLSITSSTSQTPLDAATARLAITPNDPSSPSDPTSTSSSTTKKKNKKKKKRKPKKTGDQACESPSDGTGLLDASQEAVE